MMRWLRWALVVVLVLFVGIPTLMTAFRFATVAFQTTRAHEMVLEEFCSAQPPNSSEETILQRLSLPPSEHWRVFTAMPPVPDMSAFGIEKMCYDPHHRIIIKRGDSSYTVEICFECSKMSFDSGSVGGIPFVWQHTLNSLFSHYGMPERTAEEYSKFKRVVRPSP